MSGPPPDWDRGGNARRPARPKMSPEQTQHAAQGFFAWLADKDTMAQLKMMLPDHIDPEVFIATCKTAVLTKPDLLEERYRSSLMTAIMKAAAQGLKPDGKEGALVARWDSDAGGYAVTWQSMLRGVYKLGRETGAIKSIRANIVFNGEPFRVLQGEVDLIEHEVDPEIVEEAYAALNGGMDNHGNPIANADRFFDRVRAAYCFVTGVDGTVTKRWMTKARLISLREASKSKTGPWASRWVDEMIVKGVILYTSKWINLDTDSVQAKRFHAALLTDLEVDFDRQGQIVAPQDRQQAALPAPTTKLDTLETLFRRKDREPVLVDAEGGRASEPTGAAPVDQSTVGADLPDRHTASKPAMGTDLPDAARRGVQADAGGLVDQTTDNPTEPADKAAEEPADPLMDAVAETIGKIARMSEQEVHTATKSDKYKAFVKKLNDAGRHDLIKQIADRVREKLA